MDKGILFDFGGTLDTDGVHWSEKFWEVYESINVPVEKKLFEKAFVEADNQLNPGNIKKNFTFRQLLDLKINLQLEYLKKNTASLNKTDLTQLREVILDKCDAQVSENIKNIKPLLEDLQKKYRLAVVTNFYGNMEAVLTGYGIRDLFDSVTDSGIEKIKKPDPEIWRIGINRLGINPENCFVVGDSYKNDIAPAKQLGCRTIWIDNRSWTRPKETSAADYTVNSLSGIRNILL